MNTSLSEGETVSNGAVGHGIFMRAVKHVADVSASYLDLEYNDVVECLAKNEKFVRSVLLGGYHKNSALVVAAQRSNQTGEKKEILLQAGWEDLFNEEKEAVAFIAVNEIKPLKNADVETIPWHILPFVWKPGVSPCKTALRFLEDMIYPLLENEKYKCGYDNNRHCCLNDALNGINRVSNILQQVESQSSIRHAHFAVGESLSRVAMYVGTGAKNWNIQIPNDVMLEDIKHNVVEWSAEVARILGLYRSVLSDVSESSCSDTTDDNIAGTESSNSVYSDSSSATSSDSTDSLVYESGSESDSQNLDLIMRNSWSISSVTGCEMPMNVQEEVNFWLNYENALTDLHERIGSTTVEYTLGLLEFNMVDVDNIYCFGDAVDTTSELLNYVENINILMQGFPVSALREANNIYVLKEAVELVLKHLAKAKYLKHYSSRKLTEMVLGLTTDMLHSCYVIFRDSIDFASSKDLYTFPAQDLDEILNAWKTGITHLKNSLEGDIGTSISLSVIPSTTLVSETQEVLHSFHQCEPKHETTVKDVKILMELKRLYGNICRDGYGVPKKTTTDLEKQSVDSAKQLYTCFLSNVKKKLRDTNVLDFKNIYPCINSFVYILNQVELLVKQEFSALIGDVNRIQGIPQLLSYARGLSICDGTKFGVDVFGNILNLVWSEVKCVESQCLMLKGDLQTMFCYVPINDTANGVLNIARMKGKLEAIQHLLVLLGHFVDADSLRPLQDAVDSLDVGIMDIKSQDVKEDGMGICKTAIRPYSEHVQGTADNVNIPFTDSLEYVTTCTYMNFSALSLKNVPRCQMDSSLSIVLAIKHIVEALSFMGRHKSKDNDENWKTTLELPEDLAGALETNRWDNLFNPNTIEAIYKILNSRFLEFSHMVAMESIGDVIYAHAPSLTLTEVLQTLSRQLKPLTLFFSSNESERNVIHEVYLKEKVTKIINQWLSQAINGCLSTYANDELVTDDLVVRFIEVYEEPLMEPPLEVVQQRLYENLESKTNITREVVEEIQVFSSSEHDELYKNINNQLNDAKGEMNSILSHLEEQFNQWKNFELNWQRHFERQRQDTADISTLVKELDGILQCRFVANPVGPLTISIPDETHKQKTKRLERSIISLICEMALISSQELENSLSNIEKAFGSDTLAEAAVSPSNSPSMATQVTHDPNVSIEPCQIANEFDYATFDGLVEKLKAERPNKSGLAVLVDSYIQDCTSLENSFKPIYDICIATQNLNKHQAEWLELAESLLFLERRSKKCSVELPGAWIFSEKIKRRIGHLALLATRTSDTIFRNIRETIVELPEVYGNIQELLRLQWRKLKDNIDNDRVDNGVVVPLLTELETNCHIVKKHMLTLHDILRVTLDIEATQDHGMDHILACMEEIVQYKKQWSDASIFLIQYEDILKSEPTQKALPRIRQEVATVKEGLGKMNLLWKGMENKIKALETLLNGNVVAFLDDQKFIECVKTLVGSSTFSLTDVAGTLTLKYWLAVNEKYCMELKEIVKALEFHKAANDYIDQLSAKWQSTEFLWLSEDISLGVAEQEGCNKSLIWKLQNGESLLYYIDDSIAFLNTYISSAYAGEIKGDLADWINKLSSTRTFIEEWVLVENKLKYITNIFASPIVQQKLVQQCEDLKQLIKHQDSLVGTTKYLSNASQWLGSLSDMASRIGLLEDKLRSYLDDQRFLCPRYFFLRDNELFHIIGMGTAEYMADNISKMFPGVASFNVEDGVISSVKSKDSEVMLLHKKIPILGIEPNELILRLDEAIKETIQSQIMSSIQQLEDIYSCDTFDSRSYCKWVASSISQALIVSQSIMWTRMMELMTSYRDFERLESLLNSFIKCAASHLERDATVLQKLEKLSIFLIYQLQKTQLLGTTQKHCSSWQRCIRYYINPSGFVELRIGSKVYPYGYEFLGIGANLIVTSLTEKCLTSIAEAMQNCLIANPQGPAGTGKTESVKALASLCGYPSWVFNCNEGLDSASVERTFAGLCQLGAWGIFDEFNRLVEGVLSSIAEKIQQIVICQKNDINHINLVDREIQLNRNVGIFVTINPGYISRSSFPLNMRMLCRPIVMEKVDLKEIIHVMLELNGITGSNKISNQLWDILNCCRICFGDGIYDFGLRCSKAILCYVRRIINSMNESELTNNGQHMEYILERALYFTLSPRFPLVEQEILDRILSACLSLNSSLEFNQLCPVLADRDASFMNKLATKFGDVVEGDYLKEKALQLFHLLEKSKGIILYGPSGSGKTLCLKVTLDIAGDLEGTAYDIVRFDPNALDIANLYGSSNSGVWHDGLFTYFMRKYTDSGRKVVIVFDGDMNSSWVESMNSLLDDNLVLTLNNGNRIQLTSNIIVLFETNSLKYVTLATMSRCALVRFENDGKLQKLPHYADYFEIIDQDLRLFRYGCFKRLYDEKPDLPHFIFSFVNGFGTDMGQLGYQDLIRNVDITSQRRDRNIDSYREIEDAILGTSHATKLDMIITTFLKSSMSFVLCGCQSYTSNSIITNVVLSLEGWFVKTLYLSRDSGHSALLEVLYQSTNMNRVDSHYVMTPREQVNGASKMFLLIQDVECVTKGSGKNGFWPLLRELIEFNSFQMRDEVDSWITVYLQDIFIAIATRHSGYDMIPNRLKRLLPVINVDLCNYMSEEGISPGSSIFEHEADDSFISNNNLAYKFYDGVRTFLKEKCIDITDDITIYQTIMKEANFDPHSCWLLGTLIKYKYGYFPSITDFDMKPCEMKKRDFESPFFLSTDLTTIEDFKEVCYFIREFFEHPCNALSITGSTMHIRELLCQAPSSGSGYKLLTLDYALWSGRMDKIIEGTGLQSQKICLYVDWDILVLQCPEVVGQLKNMIVQRDYTRFVTREMIEQLVQEGSEQPEVDFANCRSTLLGNIDRNLKFVFSSRMRYFDATLSDIGFYLHVPRLTQSLMTQIQCAIMPTDYNFDLRKVYDLYIGLHGGVFNFCDYLLYVRFTKDLISQHETQTQKDYTRLRAGLEKIERAKDEVSSLRAMLDSRRTFLVAKNEEAEKKLKQISQLQTEAGLKKQEAEELNDSLEEERSILKTRNDEVQLQLAEVAPLIEQSQREVESINRKSLDELRSMGNPPSIIKHTLETVVILLTNSTSTNVSWDFCRKLVKSSDFISKILHFDTQIITPTTFNIVKNCVEEPEWDINRISKASKAAGPLAKWVVSVMSYGEIAMNVRPLLEEVERLKVSNRENEAMLERQSTLIETLEGDISRYQDDYSALLESISTMQSEINRTSERIEKSESLLLDLSDEVEHWKKAIDILETKQRCILGNSIMQAALSVLSGSLESHTRTEFYGMINDFFAAKDVLHDYDFLSIPNFERHILKANMDYRHCILVDASDMLYAPLIEGPYKVVSACDEHFMAMLAAGRECNLVLLITDIVYSTTTVKRAILNEVRSKVFGSGFNIILQISSDDLLRCRSPQNEDEHYILNISELCLILHLEMSENNFESYCMDILMQETDPLLYKAHQDVTVTATELSSELRLQEDGLLGFLVDTTDILDDDTSAYFAEYKNERDRIQCSLSECTVVVDNFNSLKSNYSDFISLVSATYNITKRLGRLGSFCFFDVSLLIHAMKLSRGNAEPKKAFMQIIFEWINQSIFAEDSMYWGFELLNLYCNQVKPCDDIRQLLSDVSSLHNDPVKIFQDIENMKHEYLYSDTNETFGITTNVFDYFNMVIIVTRGFEDPTDFVESYTKSQGHDFKALAMSVPSECSAIESRLQSLLSKGFWVLLKNAHLVPRWFEKFESQFPRLSDGPKVFITWDSAVDLDRTILTRRYKIVYQGADTLHSILNQLFQTYGQLFDDPDNRRCHLLLRTLLVHAIVICRQAYIPFGWTKPNTFDNNDLLLAFNATLRFADLFEDNLKQIVNISADFHRDATLVHEWRQRVHCIYASKLSCDIDINIMWDILTFIEPGQYPIELPNENIVDWIKQIPKVTAPSMIGLPNCVDTLILQSSVGKLCEFAPSCTRGDILTAHGNSEPCEFPIHLFENPGSLLVTALRGQWADCYREHDMDLIVAECNKLQTLPTSGKPVKANLNVFSQPQKFLDVLRLLVSSSSGVKADDLELIARIVPSVESDCENIREQLSTCHCSYTKERLILDNLELVGATYDFATQTLSVSSTTTIEIREPIYVQLRWIKHSCGKAHRTTLLPIYNSRRILSYSLNFDFEKHEELIYLRNVRLDAVF
ncbi:Cytoplasmic dynein 1 heavy chain 1 [Babesia sp. Xinjiang]|uniref:Cytoplasmic dynein 1 heavy chain 1 n=1 Tax=Babesia sp. Xinjiang TaxID=462227 RepID=UPI000A2253E7|nr:Cytoplasmic dynein 1 heavy chain 1 [Babesia sp. Xinjiang]ORM39572.1 Cytoplasmic dynein 1 heavy chain 1 [Babesia sp. Xinjiang]